jgi:hypothetical protein
VSQATDGTTLNAGVGGDLVSDEDLSSSPRLSPDVPQLQAANAGYKVERTKIAIGSYGQDRGDPSNDGGRAFPVELQVERRLMESQLVRSQDEAAQRCISRQRERAPSLCLSRSGREGRT